jgi:hypothetical protein
MKFTFDLGELSEETHRQEKEEQQMHKDSDLHLEDKRSWKVMPPQTILGLGFLSLFMILHGSMERFQIHPFKKRS